MNRFFLLASPLGTNLLTNSQLLGGGAAPTSYSQPIATGTSAPNGLASNGDTIYSQTATAQRPFIATSASFTLAANMVYTASVDISAASGLTPGDVIRVASVPSGGVITFPPCSANVNGGGSSTLGTGRLKVTVTIGATAGSSQVFFGIGCNGAATGSVSFASPMFEVGTGKRYRRGL